MRKVNDRQIILIIACMASFITPFLGTSVNVAIPTINSDFLVTDETLLGWVVTGFLLSAAIFVVPFGRIADIYGRKKVFTAGMLVLIVSSILCSISNSIHMLIISRAIEGFGSAMIFGTAVAILTSVFPAEERGKVLGINMAVINIGATTGPFLGGIITQYIGWRFIYAGTAVYALIVASLTIWKIKEEWRSVNLGELDIIGAALYAAILLSLMYGLSIIPDLTGACMIGLAFVITVAFLWWELRNRNPILKIAVFRSNAVFAFSNLATLINHSATYAVAFLLSIYLQYMKGYSPQTAGLILIAQPIVQVVFSPLAGRLSDQVEPRIVASAGMGFCVIGLASFSFLMPETWLVSIIVGLITLGLGFALFSSPNTNAIMSSVDECDYGMASGTMSTMRLIGQMMSLGIVMFTLSMINGHGQIAKVLPGPLMISIKAAFIIFAFLCILGMAFSLARGNLQRAICGKKSY